ncbi:MAG: hypothetical protein FRX48_02332 [Lasallia pustulata]|uniref:Uncharacterized protein n=1 Tax=Lasallia pustulata TaxID=136370 RepID=A0A5M8PZ52_9LECA|nr:MAG: hypothetical protein FRX48_02332 [Lasallia pustulata]
MRRFNLSPLLVLAYATAFAWALPLTIDTSSLVPKAQLLTNAPPTESESLLDRHNALAPRIPAIDVVFAAGTETKVLIKAGWIALNVQEIVNLLRYTIREVKQQIVQHGDRVIPATDLVTLGSAMVVQGVHMTLSNADNHQLTYGVVQSAAVAMVQYFTVRGGYQTVDFSIIDGKNRVGSGMIQA